jgi:hypothetical protein
VEKDAMIYRKDERRFVACRPVNFEIAPLKKKDHAGPFVLSGQYKGFGQQVILGTFIDRVDAEAVLARERQAYTAAGQ